MQTTDHAKPSRIVGKRGAKRQKRSGSNRAALTKELRQLAAAEIRRSA